MGILAQSDVAGAQGRKLHASSKVVSALLQGPHSPNESALIESTKYLARMSGPFDHEYSATFLTGVGIEQRKRRPKRKNPLALEEPEAPEYSDILRNAITMEKPMASLDDLRNLIQRTRTKLDRQRKVLDGFRTDVRQLKSSSFGPSEATASAGAQKGRLASSMSSLPSASLASSLPNACSAPCIKDYGRATGERRLQRSQSAGSIRSSAGVVSRRAVQRSDSYADLSTGMEAAKIMGVHDLIRGGTTTTRPRSSAGGPRRPPDFSLQQETSLRPSSSCSSSRRLMSSKR